MNRIANAVKKGRCTFLISPKYAGTDEGKKLAAALPTVPLEENADFLPITAESFAAANQNAGIIVMLDPNIFDPSFATFAKIYSQLSAQPQLFFIGKSFNRFGLPASLQFKNIQHIKTRAIDVINEFSKKPAPKEAKKKESSHTPKAPKSVIVGREEEVQTLKEFLTENDRTVFLHGPSGIGKHWLLEEALNSLESPLKRIPEIRFGHEVGLDTLLSRIAMAGAPKNALTKALNSRENRPSPKKIAQITVETLNGEAFENTLFVVSGVESLLDGRDSSFYKERSLEIILSAILRSSLKAKFVFISTQKLQTHTNQNLPLFLEVLGLKQDSWEEMFATWHLSEEHHALAMKFADRAQGHPIAMRSLAVSIQNGLSEDLLEQSKRGIVTNIYDSQGVKKLIQKMFDKLNNQDKDLLGLLLQLKRPLTANQMKLFLDVDRKTRIALIAAGVLEKTHTEPKRYYVHPIIETLRIKPPSFEKMEQLGLRLLDEAKRLRHRENDLLEELCIIQIANNILSNARKPRLCYKTTVSCIDHILAPLRRVTFRQRKYDIAEKMLTSALKKAPAHPDALLIEHFLTRKKSGAKTPPMDPLHKKAGTPETYHYEATLFVERGQLDRATKALEHGIEAFPNNARLCRRLSGLYLRQSKVESAQNILLKAIQIQPLMPDNYSFLGDVYTRLGSAHWEKSETCFERSKELGGETPPLLVRRARLLRLKAISNPEKAAEMYTQCQEVLKKALTMEEKNLGANILMATVLLDQGGELEQIEKHLKPFLKFKEHTESFIQKARYLARKKDFVSAHNSLNKAYKLSSGNHYAFYVRGEVFFADGDLSKALEAFKNALERCPQSGAERSMYEQSIEQMKAFIQTETHIESEAPTETELIESSAMGFRRDPGMIIRRKGDEEESTSESEEEVAESTQETEQTDE